MLEIYIISDSDPCPQECDSVKMKDLTLPESSGNCEVTKYSCCAFESILQAVNKSIFLIDSCLFFYLMPAPFSRNYKSFQ